MNQLRTAGADDVAVDNPTGHERWKASRARAVQAAGQIGRRRSAISGGCAGRTIRLSRFRSPQDQPGLTATDRPVILFYVPKPAKGPAVFTIFDTAKAKPKLIEITFDEGFTTPGVQRVDLSKHNAPLKPGQIYQWNVTIPNKPGGGGGGAGGGANDGFAAGHIKYDESKTTVRDQWKSAPPADCAVAFADAGLWYDALAALAEAIDQNPTDPTLVEQRNMWLSSENIAVPN